MERLLAALVLRFHGDAAVRLEAASELRRMGSFRPLVSLLKRELHPDVIKQVVEMLGWTRDPALIERATRRLCERPEPVAEHSVRLFEMSPDKVLSGAAQVVGAKASPNVVAHCVACLLAHRRSYPEEQDAFVTLLTRFGRPAVPALVAVLQKREHWASMSIIARALGEIGDRAAAPALARLAVSNEHGAADAARALAKVTGADAVGTLEQALSHPDRSARRAAVESLASLAGDRAAEVLRASLVHEDLEIRLRAAAGLVERGLAVPPGKSLELLVEFAEGSKNSQSFSHDFGGKRRYEASAAYEGHRPVQVLAANLKLSAETVVAARHALGSQIGYRQTCDKYGGDELDMDRGLAAVRHLCADDSTFSTAILRRIAERQDVSIVLTHGCAGSRQAQLDFSLWRQLARQTLIRRDRQDGPRA